MMKIDANVVEMYQVITWHRSAFAGNCWSETTKFWYRLCLYSNRYLPVPFENISRAY